MTESVIEEDLTIEGNVNASKGDLDIKGRVTGNVNAHAVKLHLKGSIDGDLSAKIVTIEGKHKGSVQCDELTLTSTSDLNAKVSAQTMTTQNGAKIAGTVKVTGKQ